LLVNSATAASSSAGRALGRFCGRRRAALIPDILGAEITREQSLATLRDGRAVLRRRTYDDRRIDTFETGFLARYSVSCVQHDGRRFSLSACVVAQCRKGQIAHIDEYLDSSKFRRPKVES
jgi:hypothetical protein